MLFYRLEFALTTALNPQENDDRKRCEYLCVQTACYNTDSRTGRSFFICDERASFVIACAAAPVGGRCTVEER